MKENKEKSNMNNKEENIFQSLIRGETAAVETYNQLLEKIESTAEKTKVRAIRDDHQTALSQLKTYTEFKDGDVPEGSGYWGTFAAGFVGSAKAFGETATVKALKMGEEHGVELYKNALDSDSVSSEAKDYILKQHLPKMELHINTLNAVIKH